MMQTAHLVFHVDVIDEGIEELEGDAHDIDQGDSWVRFLQAIQQPQRTTEVIRTYSELLLIWATEMWPSLYSGHFK